MHSFSKHAWRSCTFNAGQQSPALVCPSRSSEGEEELSVDAARLEWGAMSFPGPKLPAPALWQPLRPLKENMD